MRVTRYRHPHAFNVVILVISSIVSPDSQALNENEFPSDFMFGVATSAYQIEGGYNADGKGPNIWDHFLNERPELAHNNSNGNIACDSYHKYEEDIQLVKNLGVQFYRFSISWSRILPTGYSNKINVEGIRYYNNIIDELLANNITPMVTMYHWDLPLPLHQIGGWTNPYVANYFEDYARVLYENFGDRVKYWITMNSFCFHYGMSNVPPLVNQTGIGEYLCSQVALLSHAKAYHLYDQQYRPKQQGKVGITIDGKWYAPATEDDEDYEATLRVRDFRVGLLSDPIFSLNGDFPERVRKKVYEESKKEGFLRSRLPVFSEEEKEFIQGTYDFLGLNLYSTYLVKNAPESDSKEPSVQKDMQAEIFQDEQWKKSHASWLKVVPWGMTHALVWFKNRYDDPEIFITENGFADDGALEDIDRINYYKEYLSAVLDAIHKYRVNVKGYAAWSLLDNFEWNDGYSLKFGLHHVDFNDPNRKRTPKASAEWYKNVVRRRRIAEHSQNIKGEL